MNRLQTKRAIYSISLTSLALTSVGCGDPIVADFTPTTIADLAIPTNETYTDPATGNVYVYAYNAQDITINKDLTTVLNVSLEYTNTDAAGLIVLSESVNYIFNGVVTPVEVGTTYTIKFTDAIDATNVIDLSCTLNDIDLNCTDADAAVWAFQLK